MSIEILLKVSPEDHLEGNKIYQLERRLLELLFPIVRSAAGACIIKREGEKIYILLGKRKHEPYKEKLSFPLGRKLPEEDVYLTLPREVEEETGLSLAIYSGLPNNKNKLFIHGFGPSYILLDKETGYLIAVEVYEVYPYYKPNFKGHGDLAELKFYEISETRREKLAPVTEAVLKDLGLLVQS